MERLAGRAEVIYADTAGLGAAVARADALLVWDFFSSAVRDVWSQAHRLSWIHVAAAGVDKLLFDDLVASPVVVTNAKGTFDRPIAEYVLACVLAHAKQLPTSLRLQQQGQWVHRETRSVAGAQALVVGTGSIGREIGRLLVALGMRVRGAARRARPGDGTFSEVISSVDLADHVGDVDYLVVATPLTPATRNLVDRRVLAGLPPSAYVINIGRGPCLDEDAVLSALGEGRLAGAALDVFVTEPLPAGHAFWADEHVLVSPHMSGDVVGWRDALARQFLDNAERWLAGEPLVNVIDKQLGFSA